MPNVGGQLTCFSWRLRDRRGARPARSLGVIIKDLWYSIWGRALDDVRLLASVGDGDAIRLERME